MWYVVRVVVCTEFFDSDSVEASSFHGPWRDRKQAEQFAARVEKMAKGEDYDLYTSIMPLTRSSASAVAKQIRERS